MLETNIIKPFQRFINIESFSGILLFCATILALIWANSPYGHLYQLLWQYEIGLNIEDFEISKPLILWINDGLMAVFFFLIGLEIKRELLIGELNSVTKAAFPFFAAIGGMLIPVCLFFVLNKNPEASGGWAIPMATDIAFSLAILKLLGDRVPISLKIFLVALAIVDDLGAVVVIALFYSSDTDWMLLVYAIILLTILLVLSSRKIYVQYIALVFGIVIWFLFLKSGIHPTLAGVLVAFAIPVRKKISIDTFSENVSRIVGNIEKSGRIDKILTKEQIEYIDSLEAWTDKVQSPLQHLEHKLHDWVAYLVMPVFAFANSGIVLTGGMNFEFSLISTIAICLVIGKCIGISMISFLAVKLGLAELPEGVSYRQVIGISFLAGVGFTMSIFVANLAFNGNSFLLDSAKLGILIGSIIAGIMGYIILKIDSKEKVTVMNKQ